MLLLNFEIDLNERASKTFRRSKQRKLELNNADLDKNRNFSMHKYWPLWQSGLFLSMQLADKTVDVTQYNAVSFFKLKNVLVKIDSCHLQNTLLRRI